MIEVIKLKVNSPYLQRDGINRHTINKFEDKEYVLKENLDELKSKIPDIKLGKLEDGEKVYFSSDVSFPRKKFKSTYPNNKIVYSVEEADTIIIDYGSMKHSIGYFWANDLVLLQDGSWCQSHYISNINYTGLIPANPQEMKTVVSMHYRGVKKALEIGKVLGYSKKYVDIASINLASEETLNKEAFERINRMLSSKEDEMKVMGMKILTAYDYNSEKHKIVLLMHLNWMNWASTRKKKMNVELKSLLRKLEIDYPGFQYNRSHDSGFWMRMSLEHPNDPVVQTAFNSWFKKMVPGYKGPNIKVIVDENNQQ